MVRKLTDSETNAIWKAIEEILGIPSKEVALIVREDEKIEADCQILKNIPDHSFNKLSDGYWYTEGENDVYVEAQEILDNRQIVFRVQYDIN